MSLTRAAMAPNSWVPKSYSRKSGTATPLDLAIVCMPCAMRCAEGNLLLAIVMVLTGWCPALP